jgi:hypothetical protein
MPLSAEPRGKTSFVANELRKSADPITGLTLWWSRVYYEKAWAKTLGEGVEKSTGLHAKAICDP